MTTVLLGDGSDSRYIPKFGFRGASGRGDALASTRPADGRAITPPSVAATNAPPVAVAPLPLGPPLGPLAAAACTAACLARRTVRRDERQR